MSYIGIEEKSMGLGGLDFGGFTSYGGMRDCPEELTVAEEERLIEFTENAKPVVGSADER